jgi:hypothetical protein
MDLDCEEGTKALVWFGVRPGMMTGEGGQDQGSQIERCTVCPGRHSSACSKVFFFIDFQHFKLFCYSFFCQILRYQPHAVT